MAEGLFDAWITSVCFRRAGAPLRQRSMMVLGSFRGQTTENVKANLRPEECDLVIISGCMTEMLQSLDAVIKRPFKAHVRRLCSEWAQKTRDDGDGSL
jgi:hypothetical protein